MGLAWLKLGTSEPEKRWIGSTPDKPPQAATQKPAPVKSVNTAQKTAEKPKVIAPPKPQFEFFNELPKREVSVTDEPLELRETPKDKSQHKAYYIQIASFSKKQDAERLRAELALLGQETHINQARLQAISRYRVMIGPFNHVGAVQTTQKQLKQRGYTELLVIVKNKAVPAGN